MDYRLVAMRRVFVLAALLAVPPPGFVLAQGAGSTTADIAAYAGPDRTERLIAGARREGTVTVYTSANIEDMAVVTTAFEKAYGVKVRVWRGSSESTSGTPSCPGCLYSTNHSR